MLVPGCELDHCIGQRIRTQVDDAEDSHLEHLISDLKLADGAAAMIAYARMQFSEMSEDERRVVEQALLKYCELDTLALVMLWEYWSKELRISNPKSSR